MLHPRREEKREVMDGLTQRDEVLALLLFMCSYKQMCYTLYCTYSIAGSIRIPAPPVFDEDDRNPPDDQPLTVHQVDFLLSQPVKYPNPYDMIYIVRAIRGSRLPNNRYHWTYQGRGYNCRHPETLDTGWMGEHGMTGDWRKRTIQKTPEKWFQVPITSDKKQSPRLLKTSKKTPACKKQSPSLLETSKKPPACVADCLIKFFNHAGLTNTALKLKSVRNSNPSIGECIRIIRRAKGFKHANLKAFDLKEVLMNVLYLFQLRAINAVTKQLDNTHAICVYNGLIYDANNEDLLQFCQSNLDKCCLGGKNWIFDGMSQTASFKPKPSVLRFITKHWKNL